MEASFIDGASGASVGLVVGEKEKVSTCDIDKACAVRHFHQTFSSQDLRPRLDLKSAGRRLSAAHASRRIVQGCCRKNEVT